MYIVWFILIVCLIYYVRKSNHNNVKKYIESKGGELISQEYAPYGKGWFGEGKDAIFKISYRDKEGNLHESWAKTGVFSSVYLSDDTIIQFSDFEKSKERKFVDVDDSNELPLRISAFKTDKGELIIEQRSTQMNVGDKVFMNNEPAPDGQYKLDFLRYIYIKHGRISSLI